MRAWWFVIVVAGFGSIGCNGAVDTDPNADADTDADADADADFDAMAGLSENSECETVTSSDGDEIPVAGATSYWRGRYTVNADGDVDGHEYWILLPNDKWTEAEGTQDCMLVFNVSGGTTSDTPGCPSCDVGLELHAEMDKDASTCIKRFVDFQYSDGYDSFDEAYSVNEQGDSGSLTWYFAPSGNEMATGEKQGDVWSFTTTPACKYF
jgi:hypothetical protein